MTFTFALWGQFLCAIVKLVVGTSEIAGILKYEESRSKISYNVK